MKVKNIICAITLLCTMHALGKQSPEEPVRLIQSAYVATRRQTPEQQETMRRDRLALIARLERAGMLETVRRLQRNLFGSNPQ